MVFDLQPACILMLTAATAASAAAAVDDVQHRVDSTRRTAVVKAVERAQPAVASIHVIHKEPVYYRHTDPLRDFFFGFSRRSYPLYKGYRDRVTGGSGLLVTQDGHVLTNDHLLGRTDQSPKIEVSLPDGRSWPARHVSSDYALDLAVLQVEADDLPVASLGKSDDILVGEWAIAIGNPFDLGPTVSIGVISALDRDFPEPRGAYYYRDMIQTDASINLGNSGGPLVNALGDVIGINSFIFTENENNIGSIDIGFAIPIDAARRFMQEVETHGRVRRPWSGLLELQDLTGRLADYLELSSTDGALVVAVASGSPAFEAELERGDVIVDINGEEVAGAQEAKGILQRLRVGDSCEMTVIKNGQPLPLSFHLEEHPRSQNRAY